MHRHLLRVALLCAVAVGSWSSTALAQAERGAAPELPELETDRDAFTPYSSIVTEGWSILEASYSFIDNRDVAETHSYPELLVRRGVSERLELRVGWNYEVGGAGNAASGTGGHQFEVGAIERESQFLYGFKSLVTEQERWRPRSAVIVQGYTPTSGEATASDVVAGYTFGWELPNRWRLDSAIRYGTEHDPEDDFNIWASSIVLRLPLDERWHAHVEYFGIFSDGAEQEFSRSFVSPGMNYLLNENLEVGLRLGWGISDDAPNFFSNVGVGWRF